MKAKLLSLVFATLIGINAQNANAVLGISGAGGLISIMAGAALTASGDWTLSVLGVILLDEQNQTFSFNSLDLDDASKLSVTENDVLVFNNELEELNIVVDEVNLELSNIDAPSKSEAERIFDFYSQGLSHSTMKVAKAVLKQ